MTPDVLFEKYPAWNPYHYSVNNPITYRDGNGYLVTSKEIKKDYPNLANTIQNILPMQVQNENLINSIAKFARVSPEKVKKDFQDGEGPLVKANAKLWQDGITLESSYFEVGARALQILDEPKRESESPFPTTAPTKEEEIQFVLITLIHEYINTQTSGRIDVENAGRDWEKSIFGGSEVGSSEVREKVPEGTFVLP
jgi:hypothetical protein